jgi:hypothetical protein
MAGGAETAPDVAKKVCLKSGQDLTHRAGFDRRVDRCSPELRPMRDRPPMLLPPVPPKKVPIYLI